MAERLIAQMKPRPALWDLRNYNYNNRTLCDREWSEMASALGFEKEVVKAKWKSLRDTYRRELRKAKLGQKSRWIHYPRMSFLRDALEARDRRRAAADTTTDDLLSPVTNWSGVSIQKVKIEDGNSFVMRNELPAAQPAIEETNGQDDDMDEEIDVEEENFPVIKEEPEVELTMDDISVRGGYDHQIQTWMDDDNLAVNPRKMFLLSLLPDIEQMSETQMRLFKKSVLQLTCQILDSHIIRPK